MVGWIAHAELVKIPDFIAGAKVVARAAQAPSVGETPSTREAGAGVEPTRGAWKAQAITVKRTREAGSLSGFGLCLSSSACGLSRNLYAVSSLHLRTTYLPCKVSAATHI